MNVYENIKAIRLEKRYSQDDLADKLGLSQNGYNLLERGKTQMTIERLQQIAEVFGMSVVDIINYPDNVSVNTKQIQELIKRNEELMEMLKSNTDTMELQKDLIDLLKDKIKQHEKALKLFTDNEMLAKSLKTSKSDVLGIVLGTSIVKMVISFVEKHKLTKEQIAMLLGNYEEFASKHPDITDEYNSSLLELIPLSLLNEISPNLIQDLMKANSL